MEITLTYVGRFTTKKDGSPLLTSKGRPYTSLRLKCNEYGDRYLSGFDNEQTSSWKEGDTVEVDIEEKGEYLNFSVPKAKPVDTSGIQRELNAVNTNVLRLIAIVNDMRSDLIKTGTLKEFTSDGNLMPDFDPKDIPL